MNIKIHENKDSVKKANKQLMELQKVIEDMDKKRGDIFINWLETQNKYLKWEETFQPSYLRAYRRSEIVFAHFGFNVGAEYGGMHYAVVMRNSSKSNPNVNVVPLSSIDDGEEDIHKDRVLLGVIKDINEKNAVAIPDQMRPISKIRIFKPRNGRDKVFKLSDKQMDLIDERIRKMYTKVRVLEETLKKSEK